MKKLLSVVLAALMLISVFPLALPQTVTAATTDRVAYLDAAGGNDTTGELGNKSNAFATFEAAYNALTPEGGTLVFLSVNSVINNPDAVGLNTHYGEITITSESDDVYWAMARYNNTLATPAWGEFLFKLGGPVTIDIDLVTNKDKAEYIYANYNPITISSNVTCYEATMATDGTISNRIEISKTNGSTYASKLISILGGTVNRVESYNTKITVNGGAWRVVAGGTRATSDKASDTNPLKMNGTFEINFNGGFAAYVFATNWSYTQGGQGFVKFTGGHIGELDMGGQKDQWTGYLDCILIYTGGTVTTLKNCRGDGTKTLIYGSNCTLGSSVSTAAFQMPKSKSSGDTTYLAGIKLVTHRTPLNVLPISTSSDTVIYLSSNGSTYGSGSASDPLRYLSQAIAVLSESGGTIKLLDDYTVSTFELNSMREFNEISHAGKITIDGTNNGGENFKIIGVADGKYEDAGINSPSTFTSRDYGFATYVLNGDTTFKNVTFDVKRELGIAANFNKLELDNVGCIADTAVTQTIRVYGGVYRFASHFTYNTDYSAGYATYSDKDTYITITGNNNTKFTIFGFSRFNSGGGAANWAVPGETPVAYAGTAHITVECGTITDIYPSVVNEQIASTEEDPREEVRKDHTGAAAVINIGGIADVDAIWTGGAAAGYGSITGDLTYNIYGDASVNNFGSIDNCDGTRYYNIESDYATYLAAYNKYKNDTDDIVLTTTIDTPVIVSESFGIKDFGDETYGVRAKFSTSAEYWEGEISDKYNIVELGVLVATEANAEAIAYVKGDYYYGATEFGADPQNYDGKIGKSVAYVKEADGESASYDSYAWAGGEADVYFTAPIVGIDFGNLGTGFVFVPYMVMVDEAGVQQVFYGTATDAVSYIGIAADAQ